MKGHGCALICTAIFMLPSLLSTIVLSLFFDKMNVNMKTIGLIGGTSWHSTVLYYQLINQNVQIKIGAGENPPLIIYSQNIELMRSRDFKRINETYLETVNKLDEFGAEAILICANTPHIVYDFVQPKVRIPILHIGEAIGINANQNGLKKLGLIGNIPTMTMGFIQKYLTDHFGITTIIPKKEYHESCNQFISTELTRGIFKETTKAFFIDQINRLSSAGAEGIILGCTELPLLITQEETPIHLIDTTVLHAELASNFILN